MTASAGPAYEATWIFDPEGDYRSVRRLEEAAAAARMERLMDEPGDAAERLFAAAEARNDLATVLGGGAVLLRHRRLTGERLDSYISALRMEGRFSEAADLMEERIAAMPDVAVVQMEMAQIAGAAGRFVRARAAAERANALRPTADAANTARRLKWVGKLHPQLRQLGWSDLRKLVGGCLMLGAAETACDVLRHMAAHPPEGPAAFDDLRALAVKALRLGEPRLAAGLVERLSLEHPDDPEVQRLVVECGGRLGHAAVAAQAADMVRRAGPPPPPADKQTWQARDELRYALAAAYAAADRPQDAIAELDDMVLENDRDNFALSALRRAVGQFVLAQLELPWAPPRPPRVINLLPYYNERMLLDLRLHEMGGWVDHFVVVEAAEAFTGRPKALHFGDVRGDYAAYGDKLLHVAVDHFPTVMRSAWAREFYQRDMAVQALAGFWRPDDIILITDADEIVDRRALAGGRWPDLANLRMATSKFFFNYVADPDTRHGNRRSGAVCRADVLARFGSSYVRSALSTLRKRWDSLPAAGWHLTNITDAAGLAAKFNDFAHQDDSKAVLRDAGGAGDILARLRAGEVDPGWAVRPLDERLPAFVRENRARLDGVMLPDPLPAPPL